MREIPETVKNLLFLDLGAGYINVFSLLKFTKVAEHGDL
jgi:hypothetical protein